MVAVNNRQMRYAAKVLLLALLILVALLLLLLRPGFFPSQSEMAQFIAENERWGPLIIIGVMILQAVVAPIPAASIAVVAGHVYGLIGALYVGIGAILGATVCFWISRWFGRGYVEARFDPKTVEGIDRYVDRHGFMAIVVARLIPFLSFDLVSYAAGITKIDFKRFFLATVLGMLPATFFYTELGVFISEHPIQHVLGTLLIILIFFYLVGKRVKRLGWKIN